MKISIVILIGLVVTVCAPINAQKNQNNKGDIFSEVPVEKRSRLVERLDEFVNRYRTKDWNGVYDLIGEQAKASFADGLSRERFLSNSGPRKLYKFKTDSVRLLFGTKENGMWAIEGCGEYSRFGPNEKLRSMIEAYLQDGDWFFSEVGTPAPMHGVPMPC